MRTFVIRNNKITKADAHVTGPKVNKPEISKYL